MMAYSDGYRMSLPMPNSVDYERMKKSGFVDHGILVVNVDDDRIGWVEREVLRTVGEKLYGKRKKG